MTNHFKKNRELQWWQIRTVDFSLFLYIVIYQRVLLLPIWIIATTTAELDELALSYVLDTPIAGNHPLKMLSLMLTLIWLYFISCIVTAMFQGCYSWIKTALLFLPMLGLLILTGQHFRTLFF